MSSLPLRALLASMAVRAATRAQPPETFGSVSDWQAEDYIVTVRVDGFASVGAAAAFGNGSKCLRLSGEQLVLFDSHGEAHVIDDAHVELVHLRQGSRGKLMTDVDDYEAVDLRIADYHLTPGLNAGFGSLAYGVRNPDGAAVPLGESLHPSVALAGRNPPG